MDFPYDEIKKENGDYFDSPAECYAAGFERFQVWSVTVDDADDGATVFTYSGTIRRVNVLGYVCTREHAAAFGVEYVEKYYVGE